MDTSKDKEKLKQLIPLIEEMKESVASEDYSIVKSQYDSIVKHWNSAETTLLVVKARLPMDKLRRIQRLCVLLLHRNLWIKKKAVGKFKSLTNFN